MNAASDGAPVPLHRGLGELAERYDGLVVDLWGCLHNGVEAYPAAVEAMQRFRAKGGRVVLVSNAPRRNEAVVRQIAHFGVPDDAWDAVMTAGEVLRMELEEATDPWYAALGPRFYHIGTDKDANLLDGLGHDRADGVETADFVLCCGIRQSRETLADILPELESALSRRLPLLSANPDRHVLRGGLREICAGTLALWYAENGGAMRQEGKPYPAIYSRSRHLMGDIAPDRVLAVGDGIETDILGAQGAGIDAVWITGGLPAHLWGVPPGDPPPQDRVLAACAEHGVRPLGVMPLLAW